MNPLLPSQISKGMQVLVIANAGHFRHIMTVSSTYNGFFMLDSDKVGKQCLGWNEILNGNVNVYTV